MCESSVGKPNDILKSINTSQESLENKNEKLETAEEAVTTDSEEYVAESLRYVCFLNNLISKILTENIYLTEFKSNKSLDVL